MKKYLRFFVSVLVLNFILQGAVFAGFREAPTVPKRPSRFKGCILALLFLDKTKHNAEISAHKIGLRNLSQWQNEKAAFESAQKLAERRIKDIVARFRTEEPKANLSPLEQAEVRALLAIYEKAENKDGAERIYRDFVGEADQLKRQITAKRIQREQELAWQRELATIIDRFKISTRFYKRQEPTGEIRAWEKTAITALLAAKNRIETEKIISGFSEKAPAEVARARAARKEKEKRENLDLAENSKTILRSFIDAVNVILKKDNLKEDNEINSDEIIKMMELSVPAKKFIYQEMQFARRIELVLRNGNTNESAAEGAKRRLLLDLRVIKESIKERDATKLKQLMALRAQIKKVNQPKVFQDILLKDARMERILSREEREILLEESLQKDELAGIIILVGSKIPDAPEKPNFPKAPSRTPPQAPKKSSRNYKAAYATYVENHVAWRASWEKYNTDASTARLQHQDYISKVTTYNDLLLRHQSARQSLLLYIVKLFPGVMSKDDGDFIKEATARVAAAKNKLSPETRSRLETTVKERRQNSGNTTTDSSDDFWFWYFYLYNPWWSQPYGMSNYYLAPALDSRPESSLLKSAFDPDGVLHTNIPPLLEALPEAIQEILEVIQNPEVNPPTHHDFTSPNIFESLQPTVGPAHTEVPFAPSELPAIEPMPEIHEAAPTPEIQDTPTSYIEAPSHSWGESNHSTYDSSPDHSSYDSGGDSGGGGGDGGGGGGGD